jgi:hypothetical protein
MAAPEEDVDVDDPDVEFTMEIENGETVMEMVGDRDAAVIVRSESGERIYLPPEDFGRPAGRSDSPYQSARNDSPYQSARDDSPYQSARDDSPYQSARDDSPYQSARQGLPEKGLRGTADGFVIRHPEPVTDLRVLR